MDKWQGETEVDRKKLVELIVARGASTPQQLQSKSIQELEKILDDSFLAAIRAEAENSPEVVAVRQRVAQKEAEAVWTQFFFRHPDIKDHAANRKFLFDFALSLSQDGIVTLQHLNEAAQLSTLDRQKPKQPLTAANLKQDEETLNNFCRTHQLAGNTAALTMLREKFGAGFNQVEIDQALQSRLITLGPASEEDVAAWAQWDAEVRADYLHNRARPEEAARIVKADTEQRRQAFQASEQEQMIAARGKADAEYGYPPLPEIHQPTGERIDAAWLNRISNVNLPLFRALLIKHGNFALTQRLRGIE